MYSINNPSYLLGSAPTYPLNFITLQVKSPDNSVLLGHNSYQLGLNEAVLYSSQRELWNMFLAGIPGASGSIVVSIVSGYNLRQLGDKKANLEIPFVLRKCHLGFNHPRCTTREDVRQAWSTDTPGSVT